MRDVQRRVCSRFPMLRLRISKPRALSLIEPTRAARVVPFQQIKLWGLLEHPQWMKL